MVEIILFFIFPLLLAKHVKTSINIEITFVLKQIFNVDTFDTSFLSLKDLIVSVTEAPQRLPKKTPKKTKKKTPQFSTQKGTFVSFLFLFS